MAAPVAWSLHRNLGFPLDLLQLILEERGLQVDQVLLDQLLARNQKVIFLIQSTDPPLYNSLCD